MNWVLLPGMDGTGDLLAPFVAQAPPTDTCVVVRYPKSKTLSRNELVRSIREYLPAFEDYIIIAESFSGQFGIEIATGKPACLRALVLVNSFAKSPLGPIGKLAGLILGEFFLRIAPPRWAIRQFLIGDASDEQVNVVKDCIQRVNGSVLASRFRMVLSCEVRQLLQFVKIPTLVISGKCDHLIRHQKTAQLAAAIPGAKLKTIDAPHLALFTNPKDTLDLIRDFLANARVTRD
jgi:pimeloyl-ACP methyl ester carboxylesterase